MPCINRENSSLVKTGSLNVYGPKALAMSGKPTLADTSVLWLLQVHKIKTDKILSYNSKLIRWLTLLTAVRDNMLDIGLYRPTSKQITVCGIRLLPCHARLECLKHRLQM